MSVKLSIQGKAMDILRCEAATLHDTPTVIARAIIETVIREGLTQKILAGVDLDDFQSGNRNRRRGSGKYEYEGRLRSIEFIAERTGVPANVIRSRIFRGWDFQRAISEPKQPKGFPKRATA